MSKLNIKLSYKNACILKHALRDKVNTGERRVAVLQDVLKRNNGVMLLEEYWGIKEEEYKKIFKEYEEEKRALAAITEEIEKHRKGFAKKRRI
ncbi:hypothetical protein EQZ09_09110 [Clostridium perfringens]|nr:hypothetical protein [Clostridium perfringens]